MHVPYERRGRVTGLIEVSWAFGLLIGVSTMGLVTAATNWRVGYLSGARGDDRDGHRRDRSNRSTDRRASHRRCRQGHRVGLISRGWLVLLSGFAITAASHALIVTFGSWLEDEFGLTPAGISGGHVPARRRRTGRHAVGRSVHRRVGQAPLGGGRARR